MHQFIKQTTEKFYIYGGITNVILTDDTIVIGSCSVVALDNADTVVTATILDTDTLAVYDTTKVKVKLKAAGTEALSPYKITFIIVTSSGESYEVDVFMTIDNI